MRASSPAILFTLGLAFALGCGQERPFSPDGGAVIESPAPGATGGVEGAAAALVSLAGWPQEHGTPLSRTSRSHEQPIASFDREVLAGDVVHYSAVIRTGPGLYDRVGIHRVVRESRPFRPIRTPNALFMLHGDLKDFEGMFIPGQFSPNLPDDFGIAVYLAQNDVDVWGIDQAWNFVPAEETSFSFFADWGIQTEADHLASAIAVARLARWITGNRLAPMLLLGYSSGSVTGYALLNEESQRPASLRQVGGFISADCGVRSDDPSWIETWVDLAAFYQSVYDSGQFQDALFFRDVALRAKNDPDGDSPYIPGLTNLQCAMVFGGGLIFGTTNAHYHAPVLEEGLPVDFQYVTVPQWLDFLENTAAYEPILFELEYSNLLAGYPSPHVAHLHDVTVPVLDIGARGGVAPYTAATVSFLGSTDVTQIYVQLHPDEDAAIDFGHIDVFTAFNAPELIWRPILDWVVAHSQVSREAAEEIVMTN
jgi:hypothetical protein